MKARAVLRVLPVMVALLSFAFPAAATAAPSPGTIVVDTTTDPGSLSDPGCSLRQAIASANDDTAYGGCSAGLPSGTDTIEVPAGSYQLTFGQLQIASDLDIVGGGARSTVISGPGNERVVRVTSGSVTITDVTIQGGNTTVNGNDLPHGIGGGIYVDTGGSLTLQDSMVMNNDAASAGGGIANFGKLVVNRSTIENNQTPNNSGGFGGGIDDVGSAFAMTNSTVTGNVSDTGGGLYLSGAHATALLNDTIARNISNANPGGGITVAGSGSGSNVVVTNTILAENEVVQGGGVISDCSTGLNSGGHNIFEGASCALNTPSDQPGVDPQLAPGIDVSGPTDMLALQGTSSAIDAGGDVACPTTDQRYIQRPEASDACDIGAYEFVKGPRNYLATTPGEVASSLDAASTLSSFGFASRVAIDPGHYDLGNTTGPVSVSSSGGNVTVEGTGAASTVLDGDGTATDVIDVGGPVTTAIQFLTVQGGKDDGIKDNGLLKLDGGVVQNNGSLGIESTNQGLQISNSTIAANGVLNGPAQGNGGIFSEAPLDVVNSTLTGNFGTAIYLDSGGSLNVENATIAKNPGSGLELLDTADAINTIVANNGGGDCLDAVGHVTSGGHNLDTDSSCNLTDPTDLHADPQLGPLAANGATGHFTPSLALFSGSPAIDAGADGTCPATDQRGVARPQGPHCDIGSFEFVAATGGSLSGSLVETGVKPVDLTAFGSEDWALWGLNASPVDQPPSALTPSVRKAGGNEISALTIDNPDGTPTRGFAGFGDPLIPFNFNWSDGTPTASGTNALGGLTVPKLGQGLVFTVPADTTERTLTIWGSAHFADGTLTARLSDGSAPDFNTILHAVSGSAPPTGDNAPGIFTIKYKAASAGQYLTVSLGETANNCGSSGCDDAVIYAAALSSGGTATGASASFSSNLPNVAMSGTVPFSDIPLAAFDPQPAGAPPISTHGLQLNRTQLNQTLLNGIQLNRTQLNQTQLNQTDLNAAQLNRTPLASQLNRTPLNETQLNQTQLNRTQLNAIQLNRTQLNQTTLNQLPLDPTRWPTGWAGLIQPTTLAGQPLQSITLQQVMSLTSPPNPPDAIARIQSLTFADLEIQSTSLAQLTVGALALGSAQVNQLGNLAGTIESQLNDWCVGFAPSGDPNAFCSGSDPGIGYLNLIQLSLLGAPVQSLQLNRTPLDGTQLNRTQLNQTPVGHLSESASGIAGMQLRALDLTPGLGIADLKVNLLPPSNRSALFDCTNSANFDCASGTLGQAQAAHAINPSTTVGDLDVNDFFQSVTVTQLLQNVLGPNSAYKDTADFGDLVGILLASADVEWEALPPNLLSIFDPHRNQLTMNAGFTIQGSGTPSADVTIDLPPGFDYVPGSATLAEGGGPNIPHGEPAITGTTAGGYELAWHLGSIDAGVPHFLRFGILAGTTVGPTQATETITSGSQSASSIAAFSVTDSFPGDGTAANATPVDTTAGNESVQMSTLPTSGAVDYYTFPMPPAGTRIQVHLNNLPADYDLALYAPRSTSVRTGATSAPPLQDGVVPDRPVDLNGGSSGQLTPTGLEDIPDPGIPLIQVSDNRSTDEEDVGMVSPGGGGSVTLAVFGYNGAFSPQAYTLRVKETDPQPAQVCPARTFPNAGAGTTPTTLPSTSSLPANLNTIVLVDEKRLGDTYGSAAEANAVGRLQELSGLSSLGVSGAVIPVESIPGVQALYNTWDANPCNPAAANAVANAIANEVNAIVAARPTVRYVVFGGGDDQIPFFRLPDLSLIANENGFAGQFGPNEYQGSLAAGDLLSDDPYLDTQPVPASGQQLFPPNLAGGRLVETASDIANAVTSFENAPTPGALQSSTAFVSGYDFVADGSQRVADNLSRLGVSVRTLDNPLSAGSTWSGAQLLAAAFPSGNPAASINSWNGHYDNYRLQAANGDVLSTSDLGGGPNRGIFFTMGCHAGFQTTDIVVGSTVLDWPQYFAQHATGFVGNTGYGLGDTDSVLFSEELMADLAGNLGGSLTLGQALLQAKQQYYLSRVAFSNYDQKTLSEAELYGLPMYGVGTAPRALMAAGLSSPTAVPGATSSINPSDGPLSAFPGSGVQSASFAATPHFVPQTGREGQYYTNDGQVQAPNYRPLQPYLSLPAARSGLVAHGVVIDSLTSADHTPFTPNNVRPTLNTSAAEPSPTFTDEAWPEKIPTLVSLGSNQSLNLITGQYFTDAGAGVERLWTQIGGRVTYSNSQDFTPPTIESIDAFQNNGVVAFTGRFSDLDQNGNPGSVAFAQVVYDDGTGNWTALPLQFNSGSGTWSGGAPFTGAHAQYFLVVCDAAGNCGYSSNKGNYFDAQPLPTGTGSGGSAGTLTLTPQGHTSGQWYTGPVTVTAITTAPDATVSVSVDGGPSAAPSGPIQLSGDGVHTVSARDSAGNTATAVYLVDTTGPAVNPSVSPAAPNGSNGWYVTAPTVSYACVDNLSGVASCSGSTTLGENPQTQPVTGTGVDNAGNVGHGSVGVKVDLSNPSTPTFSGIANGASYQPNTLPAQGAISCNSTDLISGLNGPCVVTGYSTALGSHTLTATATDKAGRTSSATLTYTVAPVTPTITWNPPATMPFGTKLSATQLNATANVPGTFAYTPPAGTILQPGPQTLSVTFTPNDSTNWTTAGASRMITVTSTQPCLTTTLNGSLTIASGTAYCIKTGGVVTKNVTIQSGGSLYMSGGSVNGSFTSTGASALTLCGATFGGTVTISGSTGPLMLGGPSGSGCAADKFSGGVTLKQNTGGISVVGDTFGGSVTLTGNSKGVVFSGNHGSGTVLFDTNSGGVNFTGNTITAGVSISNSTGGFVFSGNTISGKVTLKNNS